MQIKELPNRLVTRPECAEFLGVCAKSVARLTKAGKLPCVRPTPFSVRYAPQDIAEYIESLRGSPVAEISEEPKQPRGRPRKIIAPVEVDGGCI